MSAVRQRLPTPRRRNLMSEPIKLEIFTDYV
jgi:hypothetical protein